MTTNRRQVLQTIGGTGAVLVAQSFLGVPALAQNKPLRIGIIAPKSGVVGTIGECGLRGTTFALSGYTDAVGGEEYNMDLSSRRADAVKRYLTEKYNMAPDHLITAGYGKTHLKNANDPKSPENRRVQIVNMADK